MGDLIPFTDQPLSPQRAMERIRLLWRAGAVEIRPHAQDRMHKRGLDIFDVENVVLRGRVGEHSRPTPAGPWRYKVEGTTVDGGRAACVVELAGHLIVITAMGGRAKGKGSRG